MAWHNLLVTEAAHLSVRNSQLLCRQDNQDLTIPLEDIASITLESLKTTVTSRLLSSLAKNNTALITCDDQHHPNGIMLPLAKHSRQLAVLRMPDSSSDRQTILSNASLGWRANRS